MFIFRKSEQVKAHLERIEALLSQGQFQENGLEAIGITFGSDEEPKVAVIPWELFKALDMLIGSLTEHGVWIEKYLQEHFNQCGCQSQESQERLIKTLSSFLAKKGIYPSDGGALQ